MVDVTLQRLEVSELIIKYGVRFVISPAHDKKVTDWTLVKNVVSEADLATLIGKKTIGYEGLLNYWKGDINKATTFDFLLIPEVAGATPTVHTITFTGATASADTTFSLQLGGRVIEVEADSDDAIADIITDFAAKINALDLCVYTAVAGATTLTLTASTVNALFDDDAVVFTSVETNITGANVTTKATNIQPMTTLAAYLDASRDQARLYLVEDGFSKTSLISQLGIFQTLNNIDLQGGTADVFSGTYSELIPLSQAINKEFVTTFANKVSSSKKQIVYLNDNSEVSNFGLLCAVYGQLVTCWTPGTNSASILGEKAPIGSYSNISRNMAGLIFDYLTIREGTEYKWSTTDIRLMQLKGLTPFFTNSLGYLVMGEFSTTKYKNSDGNETTLYAHGEQYQEAIISLAYLFQILKRFEHCRFDKTDVDTVRNSLKSGFDVLSNVNSAYYLLDAEGKEEFYKSVDETMIKTKKTGNLSFSKLQNALLPQLRSITAYFANKIKE